jgi:hypothetical protein
MGEIAQIGRKPQTAEIGDRTDAPRGRSPQDRSVLGE